MLRNDRTRRGVRAPIGDPGADVCRSLFPARVNVCKPNVFRSGGGGGGKLRRVHEDDVYLIGGRSRK